MGLLFRSIVWAFLGAVIASPQAHAKKTVILAGGACETPGHPNQFKDDFERASAVYRKLGWEVVILYDQGGTLDGQTTQPFQPALFEDAVRKTVRQSGRNDEVLVQIMTHGSRGYHAYCANSPQGDPANFEAARLGAVLNEELGAKKKSAQPRLAVYDLSCYGGSSVEVMASPDICVISSSNSKTTNVNNNDFDTLFSQNTQRGRTAEEVFLRSLAFNHDAGAPNPQISSNLSQAIQGLDEYISSIRFYDKRVGPTAFTDYAEFQRSFIGTCPRQQELYQEISAQVAQYREILELIPDGSPHRALALRGLDESLKIYHQLIFDQNQLKLQSKQAPENCPTQVTPELCARLEKLGWSPIYPEGFAAILSHSDEKTSEILALWKQVLQAPGNEALKARLDDYVAQREKLSTLALELNLRFEWIRPALGDLYDQYYKKTADQASPGLDQGKVQACRRFKF